MPSLTNACGEELKQEMVMVMVMVLLRDDGRGGRII